MHQEIQAGPAAQAVQEGQEDREDLVDLEDQLRLLLKHPRLQHQVSIGVFYVEKYSPLPC